MDMSIKKVKVIFRFFLYLCGVGLSVNSLYAQNVIPVPVKIERGEGVFILSEKTAIHMPLKGEEARLWENYLRALPIRLHEGKGGGNAITLLIVEDNILFNSPESYTLSVTPQRILIRASSGAGLFYGIQTLWQLAEPSVDGYVIPAVEIEDAPRFAYRGFMLDVSRHFFPKEFIKKQIDALSFYKINRLHLHLTDAAGWRIEIKKYPLLTEIGAWRTEANWKKWWNGDRKYLREDNPEASGGYYTQEDIRELVDYARERYVTIIPEIEMPAHSEEVFVAYPQLSCSGEPYKNADFCVGNEETFAFLEDVLSEVMELFPSEYIHIGGDEAGKMAWKTCPKCQKRMKDEGLSNVDELQGYLIRRVGEYLNAHGRKMLGWDEILQGGLTADATIMAWRNEEEGISAVKSGKQVIMAPGKYCYVDAYQDAPYSQPEAIGGYLPLRKVYAYNPVPDTLTEKQAELIVGVQANLWTEYIPTPEQVEYMMYPRVLALAEVGWSAPERKSWKDFHARALKAVDDLRSKGYHPFELKNEIGSRPEARDISKHLALGKRVIYNAPYHEAYPAKGDVSLTDGVHGDWTYSDGAWQGFISKDRLDVTIDLESVNPIHSISADFMQVVGAEVYLPVSVVISISDDGVHFTELKSQSIPIDMEKAIRFESVSWKGEAKGRYIRYQARASKEHGGWVFTDEIVVK